MKYSFQMLINIDEDLKVIYKYRLLMVNFKILLISFKTLKFTVI